MSSQVAALRALIQQRFPDATPLTSTSGTAGGAQTTEHVATGIAALDCILPNGGLPRGRLSVWQPRGGATAILRAACHAAAAQGERAAWIDGDSTVAGAFWTRDNTFRVAESDGLFLVRPSSRLHALRAAEELLRSGGFSLLVLAGCDPHGTETVRLARTVGHNAHAEFPLPVMNHELRLSLESELADRRGLPR